MKELEQLLLTIDDDYLIGLTNKGTVKRARKDIEKTEIAYTDYESIKVEEAVVSLAVPLGESKCSCPSRSICKHIIMAVLKAAANIKEHAADNLEEQTVSEPNDKAEESSHKADHKVEHQANKYQDGQEEEHKVKHQDLLYFPIEKAVKALKKKSLEKLLSFLKRGKLPAIEETSVVTVTFQEDNIKVKLLEPVEHSSCSCHKKELCEHKAAAILYYQFLKGMLTIDKLREFLPEEKIADNSFMKKIAGQVLETTAQQLSAGLSRTSSSVMDEMERMAVICHNALLPDFERDFRRLKEEYELYFKRSSAFHIEALMDILTSVYNRAEALIKAENSDKIRELAGEFRAEYEAVGELVLNGVGERHFHSKTGYEGEIYYFLEETTKEWYTFTNARPIFYDNSARSSYRKAVVPWELPVSANHFSETKLHLKNAKATEDNRLSSSTETKAELAGKSKIQRSLAGSHYYDDFELMFQEKFEKNFGKQLSEKDKLVFIQADTWEPPTFDEIRQYFSMKLFDNNGHVLAMEIRYSKEEKYTIRYLERLAKYLEKKDLEFPCFMGVIYLEDGFMKLYPITYFNKEEFYLVGENSHFYK